MTCGAARSDAVGSATSRRRAIRSWRPRAFGSWQLYLLLLPAIVYTIIFCYVPMYGVQIAFKRFSPRLGFADSPWVGFHYFEQFFSSYYFWRLIKNTLTLGLYSVSLFWISIVFALALNELRQARFKRWAQTLTYAPHFISIVVVVGMLYSFLNPSTGLVNAILQRFGHEPILFLESPAWFPHLYVWSGVWQYLGWGTIIYLAALTGIDMELLDAAKVDGASRLQRIRHVNLPAIMPAVTVLLVLDVGRIMSVGFEKVLLMQNSLNMSASDVIQTFVYRVGILDAEYSYATAVSLFDALINITLLVIANVVARRSTGAGLW